MVKGLWDCQVYAIIDVKLGDADGNSYRYEGMAAILAWLKTIKKKKHGKNRHDQMKHFSLFFLSVDRMIGREALVVISKLS